jgi:hypothetical protein
VRTVVLWMFCEECYFEAECENGGACGESKT